MSSRDTDKQRPLLDGSPKTVTTSLGLSLTVHVWGPEHAPPMVLLHGFMDSAMSFRASLAPLASKWRVIAPDQRGHGDSQHVGAGGYYHFPDYVLDLHAVIEAMTSTGEPKPVIVGHSMGASVAVYFAGAFPDQLRGLVLIDGMGPQHGDVHRAPTLMRDWVHAVASRAAERQNPTPRSRQRALRRLQAAAPGLQGDDVERIVAARTRAISDDEVVYRSDALHRTPSPWTFSGERFEAFCRAVTVPTMAIWGERTPFRHAEVDRRQRLFADFRQVVIERVGHNIHLEAPHQLGQAIERFVERLTPP